MTEGQYEIALQSALAELAKLMDERDELDNRRDELDNRISRLRGGLFGLAILCGTDTNHLAAEYPNLFPDLIGPDIGLTDAIRKAMDSKRVFVSPVELRGRLETMGYDVKKSKNILASIHTVLKRLVDSGEVDAGNRDGKVVYRWKIIERLERATPTGSSYYDAAKKAGLMQMGPPPDMTQKHKK